MGIKEVLRLLVLNELIAILELPTLMTSPFLNALPLKPPKPRLPCRPETSVDLLQNKTGTSIPPETDRYDLKPDFIELNEIMSPFSTLIVFHMGIITTGQKIVQNQRFEREPGLIEGAPGRGGLFCEGAGVG